MLRMASMSVSRLYEGAVWALAVGIRHNFEAAMIINIAEISFFISSQNCFGYKINVFLPKNMPEREKI